MTRFELYHQKLKKDVRKGPLIFLLFCILLLVGMLIFKQYYHPAVIRVESPNDNPGKKVAVYMPNGQKVFTFEKYIVHKKGKMYYKNDTNSIDLTGGTIKYENWK